MSASPAPIARLEHADGRPRSYPAAVVHDGVAYPCGQVPVDAQGNTPADIAAQVKLVLDNLAGTLRRAGPDLGALLEVTVYLVDPGDFDEYDRAYGEVFAGRPMPRARPSSWPPSAVPNASSSRPAPRCVDRWVSSVVIDRLTASIDATLIFLFVGEPLYVFPDRLGE